MDLSFCLELFGKNKNVFFLSNHPISVYVYVGGQWFNGFDHSKDVWPFCIQVVIVQTLGAKYDPFLGPCLVVNNLILGVPSGKHTKSYWKWPIEIVDLPINSMVIFNSYVKLPEGTQFWITEWKNHSSLSSGAIHPCFFFGAFTQLEVS